MDRTVYRIFSQILNENNYATRFLEDSLRTRVKCFAGYKILLISIDDTFDDTFQLVIATFFYIGVVFRKRYDL